MSIAVDGGGRVVFHRFVEDNRIVMDKKETNFRDVKQVLIAGLWVLIGGFLIWVINFFEMDSFSLDSYTNFMVYAFSGNVYFSFASKLYGGNINDRNEVYWDNMLSELVVLSFLIAFNLVVLYIDGRIINTHGVLSIPVLFLSIFIFVQPVVDSIRDSFREIKG